MVSAMQTTLTSSFGEAGTETTKSEIRVGGQRQST